MNSIAALPEMFLLFMGCVVLLADVYWIDADRRHTYVLSQATLIIAVVLCAIGFPDNRATAFYGLFVHDAVGAVLKISVLSIGIFVLEYARAYLGIMGKLKGEFFVLALFSILGMMVLIAAGSLLSLYLGLELMSLCLYAMVALDRDSARASEAAMKYFVLGALASGMLLYGISMLYGLTGSIDMAGVVQALQGQTDDKLRSFALVFIIMGVAFKLGAVPLHMWVPDVYHGAPTGVTLFVGSIPKIAAFAMLTRLLFDALPELSAEWRHMLMLLAVLSLAVGNVIAIAQQNIKRMLAYSTIAHVGFLLLGVIAGTPAGFAASMFYVVIYALMTAGAFGMVVFISAAGEDRELLDDFSGLSKRAPWFALVMLVLMFSMAGVPPFAGFWAKWFVLAELVHSGSVGLAALAVVFSVIGAFYYLRVIKLMYFDEPKHVEPSAAPEGFRWLLSVNGVAILALGIMPGTLMQICLSAFTR